MMPFPIPAPYLYVAAFVVGAASGWAVNGWRLDGELEELRGDLRHEQAQVDILSGGLRACKEGVEVARQAGDKVDALKTELLAEVRKANAPKNATVAKLEKLLEQPATRRADGKPAGCDDAWQGIEADHAARQGAPERKAGAAP